MEDLVVCNSPFMDRGRVVARGQVWAADDPMVDRHRSSFGPLVVHRSAELTNPTAQARPAARPARRRAEASV